MEKIVLRNYETFEEIPDALLEVKPSCNLMYVRIGRLVFIAREFVDKVISDNDSIKYKVSYYNVKNNENILTISIKKVDNEIELNEKREDVDIIPLQNILNIKQNNVVYLTEQDIENLTNFRDEYVLGKKVSIV